MRTDEYFSQLLLEMINDEDHFAADLSGTTPPGTDEWATVLSKEELQSIADAVRYPHESTRKQIKVSLPPYLVHIVLCFCFCFCLFSHGFLNPSKLNL